MTPAEQIDRLLDECHNCPTEKMRMTHNLVLNPNASAKMLDRAARETDGDGSSRIFRDVASHPNTSGETLHYLVDEFKHVPTSPGAVDRIQQMHNYIIDHPNTTHKTLNILAQRFMAEHDTRAADSSIPTRLVNRCRYHTGFCSHYTYLGKIAQRLPAIINQKIKLWAHERGWSLPSKDIPGDMKSSIMSYFANRTESIEEAGAIDILTKIRRKQLNATTRAQTTSGFPMVLKIKHTQNQKSPFRSKPLQKPRRPKLPYGPIR